MFNFTNIILLLYFQNVCFYVFKKLVLLLNNNIIFYWDKIVSLSLYIYFSFYPQNNYLSIQVLFWMSQYFFLLIIFIERFVNILGVCKSFCYFIGKLDKENHPLKPLKSQTPWYGGGILARNFINFFLLRQKIFIKLPPKWFWRRIRLLKIKHPITTLYEAFSLHRFLESGVQ